MTVTIHNQNQILTSFEFEEMPEDKEAGYGVLDEVIEWLHNNGYTCEDHENDIYHSVYNPRFSKKENE